MWGTQDPHMYSEYFLREFIEISPRFTGCSYSKINPNIKQQKLDKLKPKFALTLAGNFTNPTLFLVNSISL